MTTPETPIVQPGSFLTLHYRLTGPDGDELVNTFNDKPATLSLGSGDLSPQIEARLLGLAEGTHVTLELAEGEAFGQRNPEMLQRVAMNLMRDVVQFPTPDGQASFAGVLLELDPEGQWALFDFNHPLAGHKVSFEVQLIGVL